nr:excalibur calcium-binding domain-containing protein [Duganella sp. sic0402]
MRGVGPAYSCDGRKYCSEMRSCGDAKDFFKHCPTVKMDGDNDGISCENQWCT